MDQRQIKAVLFDMGGVIMEYNDYQRYFNFYKFLEANVELKRRFHQFECGQITIYDIEMELLAPLGIKSIEDIETRNPLNHLKQKNLHMDRTIKRLRDSGKYVLGLLTNNGFWVADRSASILMKDTSDFHFVIESCKIGRRKPNPEFYEMALEQMGLLAGECIFIDDLEINCKGAEAVGIRSIWLKNGDFKSAIEELEKHLGEKLLDDLP